MQYEYYFQPKYQRRNINIRAGDKYPSLEMTLINDETGVAVDLTGGTGYILIKDSGDTQVVSGGLSISATDAVLGKSKYTLGTGELEFAGRYSCEFYFSQADDGTYFSVPEGDLEYIVTVKA